MVESARAGHDGLLRGKPSMGTYARDHGLAGFDLRILDIDRSDPDLPVTEQSFVMRRHVVLDQIRGTFDFANEVCLIAAIVEVSVADLSVIFLADRVVPLADVHRDVSVVS